MVLGGEQQGDGAVVHAGGGAVEQPHPDLQAQLVDRDQDPEVAHGRGERVDAGPGSDAIGGGRVAERQVRGTRRGRREDHPRPGLGALAAPLGPLRVQRRRDLLDPLDQRPDRQLRRLGQHDPAHLVGVVVGEVAGLVADRAGLGFVEPPGVQRVADLGQPLLQIVGQVELAARHGARPAQLRRDLVAGVLVARREALGAPVLRPAQMMDRLEQLGGRPVLQPPPAPHVGSEVLSGQRGRGERFESSGQLRAGRDSVQLGHQADPDTVVDAHEKNASPDPRQ
ncbi:hypothetical protein [Actinomycetospora sp. NBC_00405]|uniref:hypothetical protein n=1 Tax=Actinomycetospora sp. NBC_00405 TaxID=2975952 RepID=UPI002E1AAA4C